MSKRKREKGEFEPAEVAKHKKVKAQSEATSNAIKSQALVEVVPKVQDNAPSGPNVENSNKALKRREARRLKREKKQAEDPVDGERDGSRPVRIAAAAIEIASPVPDIDPSNKAFQRQESKKRRKEKRQAKRSRPEDQGGVGVDTQKAVIESQGHGKSQKKAFEKSRKDNASGWRVSEAAGGQMLDLDPLFSQNEEYLLLAYDPAIYVYSTSTSLLVRRLRASRMDSITGFTFSPQNPNHLYVSTRSGMIEKWDWIEGVKLEYWNTSSPMHFIVASKPSADDEINDLVYTIDRKGDGPWMITAHRLLGGSDAANTDLVTLRKYPEPLTSLRVYEGGRVIVATSGSCLMIGTTEKPNATPLRNVSYTWREVQCPEWITSIDVQIKHVGKGAKKTKQGKSTFQGAVHIVLGGLKGAIFMYEDLLRTLVEAERHSNKAANITSQRKHWHRNAVLSVKWSADGNYIISGGLETVLQIWQLETGMNQPLPHLSAPVESIVVSPAGSSYAVRLADNSAMILSTSELQPTFSVSGVQMPTARRPGTTLPHLPTIDAPSKISTPTQGLRFPATAGSTGAGRLLLAVPSSTSSRQTLTNKQSAVYLQTFDIHSSQQVSRQALTRANVTDVNIGPESNVIEEPNVTNIQISFDGQWLATVDEWIPPARDMAGLAFDKEKVVEEQNSRLEVYLKFWSWNDETKMWELVSRVDNPHASPGKAYSYGRVEDLASDPSSISFSTIGDDGVIRIWKPSIRIRHGLEIRGKDNKALMSWKCRHTTALQAPESATTTQPGAKIAYSSDGSILAAAHLFSPASAIHIIDTSDGTIRWIKTNMYTGPLLGLAITHRHLITLSLSLQVYDLVNEEPTFGFALHNYRFSLTKQIATTHLAADHKHNTFAIALPELGHLSKSTTKVKAQVVVFDPANPVPLFSTSLPNTVTSLLPAKGQRGYYAIDSEAEIRTLTPSQVLPMELIKASNAGQTSPLGLQDIYGNGTMIESKANTSDEDEPTTPKLSSADAVLSLPEPDVVVVSQDRLAEVFDTGSSGTLPPVTELFERVAGLFATRSEA